MQPLADDWEMVCVAADLATAPDELPQGLDWIAATVPGTAADALRAAGRWDGISPLRLNEQDVWYRTRVDRSGAHGLRCEGLATLATMWIDGVEILQSSTMFVPVEREVTLRAGAMLYLRFRSVLQSLQGMRDRPRWRPRMIAPPALRRVRTTLLGHMSGWCPDIHTVGPWRAIDCVPRDHTPRLLHRRLHATLQADGNGRLRASLSFTQPISGGMLEIDGQAFPLLIDGANATAEIILATPAPWWPHTHGRPALYDVQARVDGAILNLGQVGFRQIILDRGADDRDFQLFVNGQKIFCRGANWITADIAALANNAAATEAGLHLAVGAHINMLRVPGVAAYESDAFYRLCDRLGILVWQDCAFANFDYPTDDAFLNEARAEIGAFLDRTSDNPCLAVVCGGSEIAQQAAMMGAPAAARAHPLFDRILPEMIAAARPDIVHAPHSPFGDPLPFLPDGDVTHYYGVGAYQRPLADARAANVRFASECLAFANPPDDRSIDRDIGCRQTHDPRWKQGVPRDAGAAWDFEDVRDFYLRQQTGLDPARLRYEQPDRYLDLSRAVLADIFTATFNEWRRPGSSCAGALVWTFQDLRPGAGWGIIDRLGVPKSPYYALRRACQPVRIAITDEGLNGLALHALNETETAHAAILRFCCVSQGQIVVAQAERMVALPPRSGQSFTSAELLPSFFDVTYAYRFGPPAHDLCTASLHSIEGGLLSEDIYMPQGLPLRQSEIGWQIALKKDDQGWMLTLQTDIFSHYVRIEDRHFTADDNWFHMIPRQTYNIRLHGDQTRQPEGRVVALNGLNPAEYRAP